MEKELSASGEGKSEIIRKSKWSGEPDYTAPIKPIAEFVAQPDFPNNAVGEHVDIGGFTGVVTSIVKDSIRVRSAEGATQSFNSHIVRRLYGPRIEAEPTPRAPEPDVVPVSRPAPRSVSRPPPEKTIPDAIVEPNFDQPITPITTVVDRADFPEFTLGKHVEIGGYSGVVVEIAKGSLKVRSPEGTSRNYNALLLRKIYGNNPR
jgi:hypothetical protein